MEQLDFFSANQRNDSFSPNLVSFIPDFLDGGQATLLYEALFKNVEWKQETLKVFGRDILTPRLTAWYGDEGISYRYSGKVFHAKPWTEELLEIKKLVSSIVGVDFNSVLLNLYRDGNDSMAWHSDNEPELGPKPIIASVNLGEERRFDIRNRNDHDVKRSFYLGHGFLLVMGEGCQTGWQHQIAKTKVKKGTRINLTFRKVVS